MNYFSGGRKGIAKPRIALLTHLTSASGGGVAQVVQDVSDHLLSYAEVNIFGLASTSNSFSFSKGVRLGKYGFDSSLYGSLCTWRPDLIHLHGLFTFASIVAFRGSQQLGVPLIVSPHGMLDTWALKNSSLKKSFFGFLNEKRMILNASVLHSLNSSESGSLIRYGADQSKIVEIPNGVDIQSWASSKNKGECFKLLFLGRLHPKKGLVELITSIHICCRKFPTLFSNFECNIVGWGDELYVRTLRRLIESLSLSNIVLMHGAAYGIEKSNFFRSADAFILPSYSEGLPVAILEAWSYGLPVLMTSECNLECGFDCEAANKIGFNPDDIAASIYHLVSSPRSKLESMGRSGFNLVNEKFSWKSIAQKYSNMYFNLLDSHET